SEPERPVAAIVGLGYEPDKAVGAYEFLEAASIWVFQPLSEDARYMRDVERANRTLLKRIPNGQKVTYRVDQPISCFGMLESVVYGMLSGSRPVLLPFGPKIFALCAMLVATIHRSVPVWRVTAEQQGEPIDREPSSKIVAIRVVFGP